MDNLGKQIKQEAGSSGFMKTNESNLTFYEQFRVAAWWGRGRPEARSGGRGQVKGEVGLEEV